jgi:16S rRNA (guanine(527)-N(7))-methyltransferase RsmG
MLAIRNQSSTRLCEGLLLRPGRTALEAILEGCGISLTPDQIDSLWHYHQLFRSANPRLNLTRIHNFENIVLKHYSDSLLVLKFLELPSPLIDMGSGPGLPGIPLAIARPEIRMILAEPRGGRAEFLTEVCTQLGLRNVEIYAHKVGLDYPGTVSGVITRAVGTIPQTLERVAACLGPGGRMIFMKGPECDPEIEEAGQTAAELFRLTADHHYRIPGTPHERRLVIYERLATEAPVSLRGSAQSPGFDRLRRELSSESNPSFRTFRDLLTGRGVRKHGQALIAGPRIIAEVRDRFPERVLAWITDDSQSPPADDFVEWYRLSRPLFKELDVAGTNSPLLLVSVPTLPVWSDDQPWPEGCTLFIPFQDPENVGAVLRSAAAFGVARIVLLRESAHPFHPRSSRAAGTALFQVTLHEGPSIHELSAQHVPLIALDTSGPALDESPFPSRFGLVVGVEGPGLPERLRQGQRRRIPISSRVESLNAATAAAVALYVWSQQAATV